jgi:phosphoribosylpyrophosphate synthetase
MRQTQIFSGSSHPALAASICDWLGQKPGEADLGKFANGETQVQISEQRNGSQSMETCKADGLQKRQ